jgi:hypothetical protein
MGSKILLLVVILAVIVSAEDSKQALSAALQETFDKYQKDLQSLQ